MSNKSVVTAAARNNIVEEKVGSGGSAAREMDDPDLHMAIELSRQTFMEEQSRMEAANQPDLMVVEDPVVLQRNWQIQQIKQLLRASTNASPTNPFLPFTPIGPPSQPVPLSASANFAAIQQQPHFAMPSPFTSHNCFPSTSSAAATIFEVVAAPAYPFLQPRIPPVPAFPTTFPNSNSFHRFPNQPPVVAHSSHSSCSTPTSSQSQQQQQLSIQTNLCSSSTSSKQQEQFSNLSSPLKIPFRHGDLIDLHSPRSAKSMALEEFDPLYKKLEILKAQKQEEEVREHGDEMPMKMESTQEMMQEDKSGQKLPEQQQIEIVKNDDTQDDNSGNAINGSSKTSDDGEKPVPRPRKSIISRQSTRRQQQQQHRLLECDDLKAEKELTCNFYKEKQLLSECSARLARDLCGGGTNARKDVFFMSPIHDYFITSVDTIKLRVHQDDTWPRDMPEEPRRMEFACDVRNTSEEILVDVLLRLLPQEEIARNEGQIPLADYALKVYGTDEFLVRDAPIGKHPFVADYLAKGQDVDLEVGKCGLRQTPFPNKLIRRRATVYPVVNEDLFQTFIETLKTNAAKCVANPEDRRLRQPVLQSIKMITTFMNKTQPTDLISAIDLLYSSNSIDSLHEAINFIVISLIRLFRAYCRSSLTDFSIHDPLNSENCDGETQRRQTIDAAACNEKLLMNIESAHNLPGLWETKYKCYFLEAHLMYGPKSYGRCSSPLRSLNTSKYGFNHVPIQFWTDFDVHISSLPRESQVCFILRGMPIVEENATGSNATNESSSNATTSSGTGGNSNSTGSLSAASSGYVSARNSANNEGGIFAHQLAFASLPLYNVDGMLVQGALLLPLRQMDDDVVQPWGPRPLIRCPDDIILMIKALEFDYNIQFPREITPSKVHWGTFDTLPADEQESLRTLIDTAVSHQLADDDREFLWSNRHSLHQFPRALPLVLSSSFSWGSYSLGNIYALLQKWATLPPILAMELLLPYFQDQHVREFALRTISGASSEFLFNFIAQFVEALRYETFENSALAFFLLQHCTKDRGFAFELFWQLQQRVYAAKSPTFSARCQLLQQQLLELNIPGFENEIAFQQLFLDRLDRISTSVKSGNGETAHMMKVLHKELYQLTDCLDMRNVRIPIAPSFRCKSIAVQECAIFNSLTKPIKIMVNGKRNTFGIIYKAGDDLRQDAVVIQLVRAMNDIWLSQQLDLRMVLFRCLPTGNKKGLIELVPQCSTLREIQIQMGSGVAGVYKDDVLNNWLARQNTSEFQYKAALENFRRSCAGWCVATYVLGIGDRHNDNILMTTNGHVFHIDFGKYMGDWQMAAGFKRDRVPFVFTPEMAFVINGGQSGSTEHFQRFVDECCQALNLLRRDCSTVLNIMRFLSCSDIPGMCMDSVNFVENNLMLDLNDVQATVLFTRMIEDTLQSRFPRLNFFAHTLAQFKGNPLQISGVTKAEDMNRLSFISEIYTEKLEGRIESVLVNSYEKWQENGKKIYMYKLLVKRVQENVNTQIYRSFQEFQELHWKLSYRFSSRAIPPLSHTVNVGRTNIRAVAVRRHVELQYFLQRLFALSDEVAHSDLVYTFLHPLFRDTEPESRNLNGMPDLRADGNFQCQVLLHLAQDQPNNELRIFVGHAKNLPLIGREQAPDSYVKTYLRWGVAPQQKHWKRKTQVVRNAQNPTYNAELCYSLASLHSTVFTASDLSHLSVDVSIWHSGTVKDNFMMCETRVHLNQLDECVPDRKGVKHLESWFALTPCYV